MGETANSTKAGPENHIGGPPPARDPSNLRKAVDAVFGVHAQIIEGLPIEVGHGALPVEEQLLGHLKRIHQTEGVAAATATFERLLANKNVNAGKLTAAWG